MSDLEKESYSCYNCNHLRTCGIQREMHVINEEYGRRIHNIYSILAKYCTEFDLNE